MASTSSSAPVVQNLQAVQTNIDQLCTQHQRKPPTLVAVSKIKPASMVKELYDVGHRDFGENYVQELLDKSKELPDDIRWHFIGHLQSNKANKLVRDVPNLYSVQTVDTLKLAKKLDSACALAKRGPLNVLVQVNTSGEASKSGVEPDKCVELTQQVMECKNLAFQGLMTIGRFDDTPKDDCFKCLVKCRDDVCAAMKLKAEDVELSMGMSGDYPLALAMGSTIIRVGSTIFGARPKKT